MKSELQEAKDDADRLKRCLVWLANSCHLSTYEHNEVAAVLAASDDAIARSDHA